MSVQQFCKKPVVVDAYRWNCASDALGIAAWGAEAIAYDPSQQGAAADDGMTWGRLAIETMEGTMLAAPGDWIIKDEQGAFCPCRHDIFRATYEPVPAEG